MPSKERFTAMSTTYRKAVPVLLAVSLLAGVVCLTVPAQPTADNVQVNADTFDQLRKQIRPQPGESRWLEIPWLIDVHEARQQAAAEGKPMFVYSGGGATGIGAC
jgi:hypothetical protein